MNILTRFGEKRDLPAVHALIKELATYEKAPEAVTNTIAQMEIDGFGDYPVYYLQVAEADNVIVGMAIYFIKYSTWKGKGIYLDDIVVNENYRGMGIGKLLLDAVIMDCKKQNVKLLHWQVLDWNEPAINFYKKYNTTFESEWMNCKLTEQQLKDFKI